MTIKLQLASKSPRRRELLQQIGVPYTTVSVDVPECHEPGESPEEYVCRLAQEKARAGANASPGYPTLGSDTIVVQGGVILEKPASEGHFYEMMSQLSASEHEVMTAVCLCDTEKELTELSVTQVCFKPLTPELMKAYWATGEPADKAGGYGIQGKGAALVNQIKGSYSAVVGLPIEKLIPMLEAFSIPYWSTEAHE